MLLFMVADPVLESNGSDCHNSALSIFITFTTALKYHIFIIGIFYGGSIVDGY